MTIRDLEPEDIVIAFQEFVVHVLSQAERGTVVPKDKLWKYARGYIRWFYRVFYPIMREFAPFVEYTVHVPPYEEVIVEQ